MAKSKHRYRGYRYDTETGLYYLQSRYYSPEWGRFINADGTLYSGSDLLGHNLYTYCFNNPANMYDSNGCCAKDVRGKVCPQVQAKVDKHNSKPVKTGRNYLIPKTTTSSKTTKSGSCKTKISIVASTNGHGNVPPTGKPNSTARKPNGDLRSYGPDGRAKKDTDYSHPDHHPELENPHEHDWEWDENGIPHRGDAHNFGFGYYNPWAPPSKEVQIFTLSLVMLMMGMPPDLVYSY